MPPGCLGGGVIVSNTQPAQDVGRIDTRHAFFSRPLCCPHSLAMRHLPQPKWAVPLPRGCLARLHGGGSQPPPALLPRLRMNYSTSRMHYGLAPQLGSVQKSGPTIRPARSCSQRRIWFRLYPSQGSLAGQLFRLSQHAGWAFSGKSIREIDSMSAILG
jgi:hypothetical protein